MQILSSLRRLAHYAGRLTAPLHTTIEVPIWTEYTFRSDIKITQAHVVTPVYLNNSNDWKMDRLSQVLKATRKIKGNEIPVTIYILSDGRKLTDSQITEKSKLKNQGIVFTH